MLQKCTSIESFLIHFIKANVTHEAINEQCDKNITTYIYIYSLPTFIKYEINSFNSISLIKVVEKVLLILNILTLVVFIPTDKKTLKE